MAGEGTVILAFVLILLGFYFQQLWVSFIFVIVILALIATTPTKKSRRQAVPRGPIVRPIIVKRRYIGPKSIYPEKMKIKISDKPDMWWENAGKAPGKFFGNALRTVKNAFSDEENQTDPNPMQEWVD